MKRTSPYNILLSLSLVLVFLSGCIQEDFGQAINNGDLGEEIEVTFQYNTSEMSVPQTRGVFIPEEQMNIVQSAASIHVLVYKIDGNGDEVFAYHRGAFKHSHNGSSGTFRVRLAKSAAGEKYSMDFLFNITSNRVTNLLSNVKIGDKREDVREVFYDTGFTISTSSYFPMWAGLSAMEIKADTSFPTLTLIRSFARIDVGLNLDANDTAQGIDNFKLTSVGYVCHASRFLYIPDRNNINAANKVIAPSFSSTYDSNINLTSNRTGITDDRMIGGLFPMESSGEYSPTNNANRHFGIIIGGVYTDESGSTSTQYYRISLTDPNDPAKRIDILRNHKYRINIVAINGPGYSTTALARDNPPMNVVYELSVHEKGDINHIVYNNASYLGVSTTFMEFDAPATTGEEIKVRSNNGSWSVKSIFDEKGATPNWINFTTRTGVVNVTGTAKFNLTQNTGSPRIAYVTFATNTFEITVRILQNSIWYISSNYISPNYMLGDGDEYEVYVWGAVPGLLIRAWSPDHNRVVSRDSLTTSGGVVSAGSPITLNLEIVGNAVLPNKIRQVQFQYSEDGGTTWIPFEEGPQGKGHFKLKSSGRIVSLYDYKDRNGKETFSWAEAMGIDPKWNSQNHLEDPQYPYFYRTIDDISVINLPFPGLTTGNNRNSLYYTPHPSFLTGCADYEEPGYENIYPKGGWRLPSVQELREINLYEEHIGDLAPIGGAYWSSTDQHVTGGQMPGSYRIIINPNPSDPVDLEWLDWFIPGPRYSEPSRARCVYGDPVDDVIKEQYPNWYFSPNKDPRSD